MSCGEHASSRMTHWRRCLLRLTAVLLQVLRPYRTFLIHDDSAGHRLTMPVARTPTGPPRTTSPRALHYLPSALPVLCQYLRRAASPQRILCLLPPRAPLGLSRCLTTAVSLLLDPRSYKCTSLALLADSQCQQLAVARAIGGVTVAPPRAQTRDRRDSRAPKSLAHAEYCRVEMTIMPKSSRWREREG